MYKYHSSYIHTDEELELADAIVRTLADLEFTRDDKADEKRSCLRVQRVLDQLGCTPNVFRQMDERPAEWGYEVNGNEWHYKLRTWRNRARVYDYLDGFERIASGRRNNAPL